MNEDIQFDNITCYCDIVELSEEILIPVIELISLHKQFTGEIENE